MTRVIYSSNAVLVSDSPGLENHTGLYEVKALDRIQSANVSVSTDIKKFKQIGYEEFGFNNFYGPPRVNCQLSYYLTDSSNESILGLRVDNQSIFRGQNVAQKNINLFLLSDTQDGRDIALLNDWSGVNVFGVGNAYITNYSARAGVGEVPTASVSFDANNIFYDTYTGRNLVPSLSSEAVKTGGYFYSINSGVFDKTRYVTNQSSRPAALRSADIIVTMSQPTFAGGVYQTATGKIQSFDISIPFERKELLGFGNNFTFDRKLMPPSVGSVSFNAIFDLMNTGNYSGIFDFSQGKNIQIDLQDCSGNSQIKYNIENAKLSSENFNFSIGQELNFDGSFEFSVGTNHGFKIQGSSEIFDADATDFLQVTSISDPTIRSSVNTFVEDLKYYGLWYKMSGVYPFIGGTSGTHKYNLRDPRDSNDAFRLAFSGTGTQHSSSGVHFSGTGDYANVFFNPYSDLTGYPIHLSALFLSNEDASSAEIGCMVADGTNPRLLLSAESSAFGGAIFDCYDFNTGRTQISGTINSQAFYTATRTASQTGMLMLFRNSTTPTSSKLTTSNISGLQKPNFDIFLGAINKGGTPFYTDTSNRRFGFFSVGEGLTSGECVNLYTCVKDLQTNLGRNSQVFV